MKIRVALEDGEVVDDWSWFREEIEEAAERLGLEVTTIIHTDLEYI